VKPISIGRSRAVITTLPRTEGRQLHETESAIELLFMQFGILFPFAKKVTLPSDPATPKVAVIVELDLYVTIDGKLAKEIVEFVCTTPPVPSIVKRNAPLSLLEVGVAEMAPSKTRDKVQFDNDPVVTAEYVKHTYT